MPATVDTIIAGLRVKLRDRTGGRYNNASLLIFVKNSLFRLYREERSAFFGISDVPSSINGLEMGSALPLIDETWLSRVMNDAYGEAENINQEGTRPEVAGDIRREEIVG